MSELREAEEEVLRGASVVFATLSKTVIADAISKRKVAVAMVEEVSTAYPPQVLVNVFWGLPAALDDRPVRGAESEAASMSPNHSDAAGATGCLVDRQSAPRWKFDRSLPVTSVGPDQSVARSHAMRTGEIDPSRDVRTAALGV